VRGVAAARGEDVEAVADATRANAERVFRLAELT
jgi:Tat protein secretion system quality control protein TatD with DNase activity